MLFQHLMERRTLLPIPESINQTLPFVKRRMGADAESFFRSQEEVLEGSAGVFEKPPPRPALALSSRGAVVPRGLS